MGIDADDWWRNRREASVSSADAWSGGAGAFQEWMGTGPVREPQAPTQASPTEVVAAVERKTPPGPAPTDAEPPRF